MAGTRRLTFEHEEWKKFKVRRDALREARGIARKNYCLVEIVVKHEFGRSSEVRASVDARFWLMDPKDFIWPEAPKPGAKGKSGGKGGATRAGAVKAPSFLFD